LLWLLSKVGIVRDLKTPTPEIKSASLVEAGHFDIGMFHTRWHVASERLVAFGIHAADTLTERRAVLEARIDAARQDLDAYIQAQRLALDDLAALCLAARSLQPVRAWS
ncbi:MAG: hypothetical protein OES57_01130, partial [Acidimicrobiia bacterium]|nr:hypothetical protein [Acidimicrobiia bacterium]